MEGKLHQKSSKRDTESQRGRTTEKKRELEETFLLPDSLNPLLRLSVSADCVKGILLWQNTDLSLTPLPASQSCDY